MKIAIYSNKWSPEEVSILRENYKKIPIEELQKLLPNRSKKAIWRKASYLGIHRNCKDIKQAEEEIEKIKFNIHVAYILGALLGDGCLINKTHTIEINVTSKEFAEEFKKHLESLVGEKYKLKPQIVIKKSNGKKWISIFYRVRCNKLIWFLYFKKLIENPSIILNGSDDEKRYFLRGFMDAEGTAYSDAIAVGNTNKELIDIVNKLFNQLGFKTSIITSKTSKGKPYYYIRINKISLIQKYAKEIGFSIPYKQNKILSAKYKYRPWSVEEINKLKKEYPKFGSKIKLDRTADAIRRKAAELHIRYRGDKRC